MINDVICNTCEEASLFIHDSVKVNTIIHMYISILSTFIASMQTSHLTPCNRVSHEHENKNNIL